MSTPSMTACPPYVAGVIAGEALMSCGGLGSRGRLRFLCVALVEALDAALDVHEVLLAGEERVALRADLHMELRLRARRLELIAAGARHRGLDVLGVDLRSHCWVSLARVR